MTDRWPAAHLRGHDDSVVPGKDREDMRLAEEARRVLGERCFKYAREVPAGPTVRSIMPPLMPDRLVAGAASAAALTSNIGRHPCSSSL